MFGCNIHYLYAILDKHNNLSKSIVKQEKLTWDLTVQRGCGDVLTVNILEFMREEKEARIFK